MSVIAAALKHMLAANMPHEAILAAVEDMERGLQTDEQAERRRASDRDRKRQKRLRKSAESADIADAAPSPDKEIPHTPKEINPTPTTPDPNGSATPSAEIGMAISAYSAMAGRAGLAVPRIINGARRQRIGAIVRAHGLPTWLEAIAKVEASDFCRGANDRGWKADLDFVTQAKSFAGILEGRYDNRARGSPMTPKTAADFLFAETMENLNGYSGPNGPQAGDRADAGEFPGLAIAGTARRLGLPGNG